MFGWLEDESIHDQANDGVKTAKAEVIQSRIIHHTSLNALVSYVQLHRVGHSAHCTVESRSVPFFTSRVSEWVCSRLGT